MLKLKLQNAETQQSKAASELNHARSALDQKEANLQKAIEVHQVTIKNLTADLAKDQTDASMQKQDFTAASEQSQKIIDQQKAKLDEMVLKIDSMSQELERPQKSHEETLAKIQAELDLAQSAIKVKETALKHSQQESQKTIEDLKAKLITAEAETAKQKKISQKAQHALEQAKLKVNEEQAAFQKLEAAHQEAVKNLNTAVKQSLSEAEKTYEGKLQKAQSTFKESIEKLNKELGKIHDVKKEQEQTIETLAEKLHAAQQQLSNQEANLKSQEDLQTIIQKQNTELEERAAKLTNASLNLTAVKEVYTNKLKAAEKKYSDDIAKIKYEQQISIENKKEFDGKLTEAEERLTLLKIKNSAKFEKFNEVITSLENTISQAKKLVNGEVGLDVLETIPLPKADSPWHILINHLNALIETINHSSASRSASASNSCDSSPIIINKTKPATQSGWLERFGWGSEKG